MVKDSWSSKHDGVQQKVIKRTKELSEKKRRSINSWIINKDVSSPTTIKETFYYQRRYFDQWLKYRFQIICFPIVCIYIVSSSCCFLLDDDSERSHQITKKQGRPPKNQRKRNAATAPKYTKKRRGMSYRVINVFFDEKHRQDALFLGNTPTMCELDARKFPHKAVWDKLLDI